MRLLPAGPWRSWSWFCSAGGQAGLGPDIGGCWDVMVLGLVSACWWAGPGPGDCGAGACPLVGEARSWG